MQIVQLVTRSSSVRNYHLTRFLQVCFRQHSRCDGKFGQCKSGVGALIKPEICSYRHEVFSLKYSPPIWECKGWPRGAEIVVCSRAKLATLVLTLEPTSSRRRQLYTFINISTRIGPSVAVSPNFAPPDIQAGDPASERTVAVPFSINVPIPGNARLLSWGEDLHSRIGHPGD